MLPFNIMIKYTVIGLLFDALSNNLHQTVWYSLTARGCYAGFVPSFLFFLFPRTQSLCSCCFDFVALQALIFFVCLSCRFLICLHASCFFFLFRLMHFPESRFYVRRVRLSKTSHLLPAIRASGLHVEACHYQPDSTMVVSFPIDVGAGVRTVSEVSLWEQLCLAAFLQRYWADNQVSCTVTFDPKSESSQLPFALDYFQYQLKGISLLPRVQEGAYPQMPFEAITEDEYKIQIASVRPLTFTPPEQEGKQHTGEDPEMERYCDGQACILAAHRPAHKSTDGAASASGSSSSAESSTMNSRAFTPIPDLLIIVPPQATGCMSPPISPSFGTLHTIPDAVLPPAPSTPAPASSQQHPRHLSPSPTLSSIAPSDAAAEDAEQDQSETSINVCFRVVRLCVFITVLPPPPPCFCCHASLCLLCLCLSLLL